MEGTANPLELKGTARIDEWKKRLEQAAGRIRTLDGQLERKQAASKTARTIAICVPVVAGIAVALAWNWVAAVPLAFGPLVAWFLIKPPKSDFIGPERLTFVEGLLKALAPIAPKARITLSAQLDARRAVPKATLPAGSADARVQKEASEAWLRGSLAALPGLRLSWEASEHRTLKLARRKGVRRRTKIKTKAKYAIAKRLSVRLDADRALFAVKDVPMQKGRSEDGTVEVRALPRGWSIRARRDSVHKTPLKTSDVTEELSELRKKGEAEYLVDRFTALLSLMKLCEGRLIPASAREQAK